MFYRYLFRKDVLIATGFNTYEFIEERRLGDRMLCWNNDTHRNHKDYLWICQKVYRYGTGDSGANWFPLPDDEIPHYKTLLLLQQ